MNDISKGHLRLVTETSEQKPPKTRARRARFSDEHRRMLALALDTLKDRYGTWWRLAQALDMPEGTLHSVKLGIGGSTAMAYRVARLAGVPLEVVLTGKLLDVKRCPECGQYIPDEEESHG